MIHSFLLAYFPVQGKVLAACANLNRLEQTLPGISDLKF